VIFSKEAGVICQT